MQNREIAAAWNYHNATKHSYQSIRTNPHYLDWEIQPLPFKIYTDLEPIPLDQHLTSSTMPALEAISLSAVDPEDSAHLARQSLAELFFLSAGITKRRQYTGGEILFRAAACTGALYHIDFYLVCGDLRDLEAGVYHFSPHDFALRRLRQGDYRGTLVQASASESSVAAAPAVLISASTFWRNAWKYQARAYRHCYWDNGTILANLLAAAAARRIHARVVLGFADMTVSALLGLDTQREAALSLVALGHGRAAGARATLNVEPMTFSTMPLSKREIEYPAMREMHEASRLESAAEVSAWRQQANSARHPDKENSGDMGERTGRASFILQPLKGDAVPRDTIEGVIIRRGSTRQFSREGISFAQLSMILDRATRGIAADFLSSESALNDLYLIVNAVEGLPAGAYFYDRAKSALELLKASDFRKEAGYLGLGQTIPADCSVNIYFLTDLRRVLETYGNRGYRAAELDASIMGGKVYLAAYAQRLGASGLTFFDDDVVEFFSPHAAGKSVMFLVAVGKSAQHRARIS
jgi:SagB-type dehydrogenase family enzyme